MSPPPAPRTRPAVLSRGHRVAAALLLLALAAGGALAGDDGKKKPAPPPKEEKEGEKKAKPEAETRRKTEEELLLESLGAAWKRRDAKAVAARFPAKRKVALRLQGVEEGEYRSEQARSVLEDWFAGRTFSKVELKSVKDGTGTFRVEYVRASDRKTVEADLLLALALEEKKRVLVGAREIR